MGLSGYSVTTLESWPPTSSSISILVCFKDVLFPCSADGFDSFRNSTYYTDTFSAVSTYFTSAATINFLNDRRQKDHRLLDHYRLTRTDKHVKPMGIGFRASFVCGRFKQEHTLWSQLSHSLHCKYSSHYCEELIQKRKLIHNKYETTASTSDAHMRKIDNSMSF